MRPLIIRDIRRKEKFQIDDAYLNGYAKLVTPSVTAVYLSLCRHADINQESFPSLKLIAKEHSITTKTVQRAIKELTILNIIHFERVRSNTGKWLNNTYTLLDKSVWKETTGHQRPMDKPQDISTQTTGHQRPTKDTHKKDTHITPFIVSPLKRYSSLKEITENDLVEISEKYRIPLAFVKLCLEKMANWLEAKGKTYKNYKRGLMNWVLSEAQSRVERRKDDKYRPVDARNIQ